MGRNDRHEHEAQGLNQNSGIIDIIKKDDHAGALVDDGNYIFIHSFKHGYGIYLIKQQQSL